MNKERIEAYIDARQDVADRNYMAYQTTGIRRYGRNYERAQDEIEIAQQALTAADDHEAASRLNAELCQICSRAIRILHTKDDPTPFLRDLQALGELYGVKNPYK